MKQDVISHQKKPICEVNNVLFVFLIYLDCIKADSRPFYICSNSCLIKADLVVYITQRRK